MQIPLQRDYKERDEKHGILRKRLSDDILRLFIALVNWVFYVLMRIR
ncbi:hypothetical protein HanIR_Chr04g0163581 [Helianthus annuus]|nr:hypothetical protein HanIR_Chr04g0163581 [Helianthus annuus]